MFGGEARLKAVCLAADSTFLLSVPFNSSISTAGDIVADADDDSFDGVVANSGCRRLQKIHLLYSGIPSVSGEKLCHQQFWLLLL